MWAKRREKQEKYDKNPGSGKSDTEMKLSFPFCLCKRAPLSPGVLFFSLFLSVVINFLIVRFFSRDPFFSTMRSDFQTSQWSGHLENAISV